MTVVLAGGGTAGHVEPALAVAEELRARGHRAVMLGTPTGLENRLVPARGFPVRTIPKVAFPRKPGPDLLKLPARLRGAVTAAGRILDEEHAAVVIGFGGYVSAPAYLAARRRKLGIVVHEANPLPGMANRLGARLTENVAISVPGTELRHARLTGLPLRAAITGLDRAAARPEARSRFGLRPDRPTLLVTGGSQGAQRINTAAVAAAAELGRNGIQVLHVAGPKNADDVLAALPGAGLSAPYVVLPYAEDMAAAYAAADLAVCRSGAVTCAELAAVGLPAVFVPLPIGNGEQRRNAQPAVDAGAGVLIEDADLTGPSLLDAVVPVLTDPARLTAMEAGARRASPGDAAALVAAMALAAAGVREDGSP